MSQTSALSSGYDPTNIDSPGFDPETYVSKLLRESRLTQLIDKEQILTKQIKTLDNEMQTLVYENYNKFISATDTIRQMKKDFKTMEDEMTHLISTMSSINTNNHQIHQTLDHRRQEIRKLTSIHVLLQKLQYLFQLPTKLKEYADECQYELAVNTYMRALKALEKYEHIPSFNHIQQTCIETMNTIRNELKTNFDQQQTTSSDVVKLLLKLGESSDYLARQYLQQNKQRLVQPLELMKQQLIVAESRYGSSTANNTSSLTQRMYNLNNVDTCHKNKSCVYR
jgi:vacuolar protein sorting-associated protein 51